MSFLSIPGTSTTTLTSLSDVTTSAKGSLSALS
jgi:hypothetical protein